MSSQRDAHGSKQIAAPFLGRETFALDRAHAPAASVEPSFIDCLLTFYSFNVQDAQHLTDGSSQHPVALGPRQIGHRR